MKSIALKNKSIIKSFEYVSVSKIFPHEKVIEVRKSSLKKYLLSYKEYCIIPSIICCSESQRINVTGEFPVLRTDYYLHEIISNY